MTLGPSKVNSGASLIATWFMEEEPPAGEGNIDLIIRQCSAYSSSNCDDYAYRDWNERDDFNPVVHTISRAQFVAGAEHTFTVPSSWPTSSHYMVSLDSKKYSAPGFGGGAVPYVYCVSGQKVEVTNTALNINVRQPASGATWKFLDRKVISFEKVQSSSNGQEQVNIKLIQLAGPTWEVASTTGLEVEIAVSPTWGKGARLLRVEYAENPDLYEEVPITIEENDKYFLVTEPHNQSKWVTGQNQVHIRFEQTGLTAQTPVVVAVEGGTFSQPRKVTETQAGVGEVLWNVPAGIEVSNNNYKVSVSTSDGSVVSYSDPFMIQGDGTNLCQAHKHEEENLQHDLLRCARSNNVEGQLPNPILVTSTATVVSIVVEWLWCLGQQTEGTDFLRFYVEYGGGSGSGVARTAIRIGSEATQIYRPLWMEEHGADLQIKMTNKRYDNSQLAQGKKKICFDMEMYGYDHLNNPDGATGITLVTGTCLETVDATCQCEYETDEACSLNQQECVPTAVRTCQDSGAIACPSCQPPRTSSFTNGAELCSAGNIITVHTTPCQPGDRIMYEVKSASTPMTVQSTDEVWGCGLYWIRVTSRFGTGWALSDQLERCEANFNPLGLQTNGTEAGLTDGELAAVIGGSVGGCCLLLLCLCCVFGGGFAFMRSNKKQEEAAAMQAMDAGGYGGADTFGADPYGGAPGSTFGSMSSQPQAYPNQGYGQPGTGYGGGYPQGGGTGYY
jgi:hypothetical protein